MKQVLAAAGFWVALVSAGPISRFDAKAPRVFVSAAKFENVERCLIDLDTLLAPSVYSQPDRPNVVEIIFRNGDNFPVGRAELERLSDQTRVRLWLEPKLNADRCVPQ